ncbi:MAG: 4'-phosphopantetheinyl transferase family protein [Myxococcota bacterium]
MVLHWHAQGENELPAETGWLSARESDRAALMSFAKRRTDYLLGRFTAKRAVSARLGLRDDHSTLARIEVSNASDGAPELQIDGRPSSLAISLSDRAGWGVCVLADSAASHGALSVGCDLELVEPRSERFVRDYFTDAERAFVARHPEGEPRAELATLVWCAKESALKVLRTGLRRDTRSVEVAIGRVGAVGGWRPLTVDPLEGGQMTGWWRRFGRFVLSVAADREIPPPMALRSPGALSRATPSHAWLAQPIVPGARVAGGGSPMDGSPG